MRTAVSILLLCAVAPLFGQHPLISEYHWAEHPTVPDTVFKMTAPAVILRRDIVHQRLDENNTLVEYSFFHYAEFLRDNAAIEANNKVYIDLSNVTGIVSLKARSIDPQGHIIELKDTDLKRAQDDEKKRDYLYFAFEGLVPGSVIEYVSVMKRVPEMRGSRNLLQFDTPVLSETFDLINPKRLVCAMKSYNGAPDPVQDTSDEALQHFHIALRNVPAVESEPESASQAHRMQVVFKLDRIPDQSLRDISGFVNATKAYHSTLYPEVSNRDQKELDALIKRMQLSFARDEEDKVRTLEEYIKSHFSLATSGSGLRDLSSVLSTRTADQMGLTMLFCQVFRTIGMECETVVNNDRSVLPFDASFENWAQLDDVFLYLPSLKKFLAPSDFGLRLGWIPAWNMANDALFIRNYDMGGVLSGVGKVKHIDPLPDTLNAHDIYAKASLSADGTTATIDYEQRMTGYFADGIQPYYDQLPEASRKNVDQDLLGFLLDNSTTQEVRSENADGRYMGVRPMILKAKVTTDRFSGSAGDKVLFNIGELIGPQSEMYTKDKRTLPIDASYNRRFHRELEITLPEGYTLQNGADLAMDQHFDANGERVMRFVSSWKLEGRTLKVNIDENYRQCNVPLDHYEDYRRVVNAAADFNKVKLVLVKG